ncbi:MAG: hypothetical protein ABIT96_09935 [Ferruginibacter sp.]
MNLMEEKEISHEESLRLIHEMIGSAKSNYYESGLGALLWGFTNVICFTLAYIDAVSPNFNFPISPFFLIVITFGLQYYLDKKERKNKTATTYIDSFIGYAWLAFAISVFIITIGGAFAHIGYIVLPVL